MAKRQMWLVLVLSVSLAACAVSPTGRRQLAFLSAGELNQQGNLAFAQTKQEKPLVRDGSTNGYVRCVADAVLAAAGQNPAAWEVAVFQDADPNAFALPGGKIGVYTGLLRIARDQHQLATVIGHEVGHVLSNHANERMSQQVAVQGGLGLAGAVAGDGGGMSQGTLQALGLGAQLGILLPYSRVHEQEADRIGLDLMARAGFDPRASVALWQAMAQVDNGAPPEFMSTHPATQSRIADLQSMMGPAMAVYQQAQASGRRPNCAGAGGGYNSGNSRRPTAGGLF